MTHNYDERQTYNQGPFSMKEIIKHLSEIEKSLEDKKVNFLFSKAPPFKFDNIEHFKETIIDHTSVKAPEFF